MTEWPKNPHLRIAGDSALLPVGPLNVFNDKLAAAEAINHATAEKKIYDKDHASPSAPVPMTSPPVPVSGGPIIGTGGPVKVDESSYVIDPAFTGNRVKAIRR